VRRVVLDDQARGRQGHRLRHRGLPFARAGTGKKLPSCIANHQLRFDDADRATGITDVIAWHLLPEARGGPAADGVGLRALRW
jgi:hypothetical protein